MKWNNSEKSTYAHKIKHKQLCKILNTFESSIIYEAAGALLKIGSRLKPNYHYQISLIQILKTKYKVSQGFRGQGGNSQNFLSNFVRFFVTLGFKILRLFTGLSASQGDL